MIRHGVGPFLECSSRGDKRFSAFYAQPSAAGGQSIETLYQARKQFQGPHGILTGLTWREAKGRQPLNVTEVRAYYGNLWDSYIKENPHLLEVLKRASGLSDIFAQPGHACQATELWRIRCAALGIDSGLAA